MDKTCWDESLKSSIFKKYVKFLNSPSYPLISMLNLANFCHQTPKTLWTTLIWGRGKFTKLKCWVWADCCSKAIVILCHTSKEHLERIHILHFLVLNEIFVTILTIVVNFLSCCFEKFKIIKFKGLLSMVNPTINHNISSNNYL